jgi:hypothetical protein
MRCNEVQERLRIDLPDWCIKVGTKVAVLISPEGDQMKMDNWRCGDPNGDWLYRNAVQFRNKMLREKNDPVIKELLKQIDDRKKYLPQAQWVQGQARGS